MFLSNEVHQSTKRTPDDPSAIFFGDSYSVQLYRKQKIQVHCPLNLQFVIDITCGVRVARATWRENKTKLTTKSCFDKSQARGAKIYLKSFTMYMHSVGGEISLIFKIALV